MLITCLASGITARERIEALIVVRKAVEVTEHRRSQPNIQLLLLFLSKLSIDLLDPLGLPQFAWLLFQSKTFRKIGLQTSCPYLLAFFSLMTKKLLCKLDSIT